VRSKQNKKAWAEKSWRILEKGAPGAFRKFHSVRIMLCHMQKSVKISLRTYELSRFDLVWSFIALRRENLYSAEDKKDANVELKLFACNVTGLFVGGGARQWQRSGTIYN
jgi:hypothetical protein